MSDNGKSPDGFLLAADNEWNVEHLLLTELLQEAHRPFASPSHAEWLSFSLLNSKTWRKIGRLSDHEKGRLFGATVERLSLAEEKLEELDAETDKGLRSRHEDVEWDYRWRVAALLFRLIETLFSQELTLPETAETGLLKLTQKAAVGYSGFGPWPEALVVAERIAKMGGSKRELVRQFVDAMQNNTDLRKRFKRRIDKVMNSLGVDSRIPLMPQEEWAKAAIDELDTLEPSARAAWIELLAHCRAASTATPNNRWLKTAGELVKDVGVDDLIPRATRWFLIVAGHPEERIIDPHLDILRGLVWCCVSNPGKEVARAVATLAQTSYRKLPGIGPRAVRVGNAAVTALGMMPGMEGVYQLAYLKVKVKFGTAQKSIEKAFNTAAERAGLPRDEIEELAVPSYGLTEVGLAEEKLGEFTARLRVTGTTSTEIEWVKSDGKLQKGVPALVKEKFGDELKELKAAAKDIERMLPAQRERIDTMFLQQKEWPVGVWKERYLDHPLVGVLARRLLWEFGGAGERSTEDITSRPSFEGEKARQEPRATGARTGIWHEGKVVDLDLREIELAGDEVVRLWHPIGKEIEEVMAWREWLDTQQIQQPFKQAHREVYVLTEAERRTRTYSNRYAAHVLKQHQFNALCALRGWKNKLRMMVDGEYPPATLHLPKWGLRAEFWIEGAGTEYGTDTNESGAFLRVTTDQVRFYREGTIQRTAHAGGGGYHPGFRGEDAEPLALEEIPPLVFSEVMRDVDMFVGVASVGNDPTWADGGPNGQYRTYWGEVSFGELNGSAKTRKEVLERLAPRLKIGKVCSFEDRFLVVKGKLRSYKIHLGSGNILMTPNDQYLCIVPKQGIAEDGKVLLPFEGDRTLSVILSKAFLLAEDDKIKDTTILDQIRKK